MDCSVYVAKKLKTLIFTFDLTLNLSTNSENCFKAFIGSVSLRAFDRRLARIRCDHWFGSYQLGAFGAPLSKWPVGRYPSKCRDNYGRRSLTRHDLRS